MDTMEFFLNQIVSETMYKSCYLLSSLKTARSARVHLKGEHKRGGLI